MRQIVKTAAGLLLAFAVPVSAQNVPVVAQWNGTLATGIMAIGGETTGIILKTDKGTWELDLQGEAKLLKSAEQLDGKSVTVKGTATTREGVEVPQRRIIQVVELSAKSTEAKPALTGTVVIPAGLASFSGHTLEVKLWQYDPRLADVSADLFDELIVKDYAHETGTDTKTPFRLGKAHLIQADRSYYVTVFVTKDGKRTHMGEQDGKRGLCKVLHDNPTEVKMIARALGS